MLTREGLFGPGSCVGWKPSNITIADEVLFAVLCGHFGRAQQLIDSTDGAQTAATAEPTLSA